MSSSTPRMFHVTEASAGNLSEYTMAGTNRHTRRRIRILWWRRGETRVVVRATDRSAPDESRTAGMNPGLQGVNPGLQG
eukprot:3393724-Pyramimonas_sp.AAC.1